MSDESPLAVRTFGNLELDRRRLLGGLGPGGMLVAAATVAVAFLLLVGVGLVPALVALVIGAAITTPMAVEVGGYTIAERVMRWSLFAWGRSGRRNVYRSGVASRIPGNSRLPGIAWSSRVMDVETGRAGWPAVGIVCLPGPPRLFAVTLRCDPSGTTLVDRATVDTWIAATGQWLQALGTEPDLAQAQVTVETAPDSGTELARVVDRQRGPAAPQLATEVLGEVVDTYPRAAARAETRVTLTFGAPKPRRPRSGGPVRRVADEEMCRRIAARLPQLAAALRNAGAGEAVPMSAADLAACCRLAYDPAAAPDLAVTGAGPIVWSDAGPVAADEARTHYVHDSGVSVSWGTAAAPRSLLHDTALPTLMAPDPGLLRKRVTIIYRPLTPSQAARVVDQQVRDSRWQQGRKVRPNARDARQVAAADATAAEEATGAGVTRFAILYTATVGHVDDLDAAEDTIRDLAAAVRLNLRRQDGSQAAAFAAGLPVGIVLSRMAHIKG